MCLTDLDPHNWTRICCELLHCRLFGAEISMPGISMYVSDQHLRGVVSCIKVRVSCPRPATCRQLDDAQVRSAVQILVRLLGGIMGLNIYLRCGFGGVSECTYICACVWFLVLWLLPPFDTDYRRSPSVVGHGRLMGPQGILHLSTSQLLRDGREPCACRAGHFILTLRDGLLASLGKDAVMLGFVFSCADCMRFWWCQGLSQCVSAA